MALRVENVHELTAFVEFCIFYLVTYSSNNQVESAKEALNY